MADIDETIFSRPSQLMAELVPKIRKNEKKLSEGDYTSLSKDTNYNPIYRMSVEQAVRIKPHTETQYFPADLFKHLSPHRQDEEKEWIRNNYEAITLPVWMDFLNTCKRGCARGNYTIQWQREWPAEYKEENNPEVYVNDGIKLYTSLHGWFMNTLFEVKLKDANGIIAVQPFNKPETAQDAEGNTVIKSGSMVEPIPIYYPSSRVMLFEEDEFYLVMSTERTRLSDKLKTGFVFYYFDKETIIRIYQVGEYAKFTFEYEEYYPHGWGAVPCWKMMGQPLMIDKHIYFQSPFDFAVGNLNLALKNQINKQMSEANSAWPHKVVVAPVCDNVGDDKQRCRLGHIWRNNANGGDGGDVDCEKCHGTGYLDKPSPGSTMMVDESSIVADGNVGLERIKFIAPSTEILTHLAETIKVHENRARDILHLYSTSEQSTGTEETATGKWIDANAMLAFKMPIIDEAFTIYEGVLQAVIYMRYGDTVEPPTIIRPVDENYLTGNDFLSQYSMLLDRGAPPIVLYKILEKYIEKMYGDGEDADVFKLILAVDPVVTKKDEEIRNMVGAGTLAKWQAILHNNIFMYINEAVAMDEKFFEKDITDQKAVIIEMAKAAEAENKPSINTDIFGQIAGNRQAPTTEE